MEEERRVDDDAFSASLRPNDDTDTADSGQGIMTSMVFTMTLLECAFIITPARIIHEAQLGFNRHSPYNNTLALTTNSALAPISQRDFHGPSFAQIKASLRAMHREKDLTYLFGHAIFDVFATMANFVSSGCATAVFTILLSQNQVRLIAESEGGIPPDILPRVLATASPGVQFTAATLGQAYAACFTLPITIARTQRRQGIYQGWRSTIPSMRFRSSPHSKALSPALWGIGILSNFCQSINFVLRNVLMTALGNPYAPPQPRLVAIDSSAGREVKVGAFGGMGGWPGAEDTDQTARGQHAAAQQQPQQQESRLVPTPDERSFGEKAMHFLIQKAVSVLSTGIVGIVHLPLLTLFSRLVLHPGMSLSECMASIGDWRGYYQGIALYILTNSDLIFPYIL